MKGCVTNISILRRRWEKKWLRQCSAFSLHCYESYNSQKGGGIIATMFRHLSCCHHAVWNKPSIHWSLQPNDELQPMALAPKVEPGCLEESVRLLQRVTFKFRNSFISLHVSHWRLRRWENAFRWLTDQRIHPPHYLQTAWVITQFRINHEHHKRISHKKYLIYWQWMVKLESMQRGLIGGRRTLRHMLHKNAEV